MDVQSDHEVADGDIDIDIRSAPQSLQGDDDALFLQDAGTDGDAGDVDDDMVDKEDLIEEDEIGYDDLELEDAGNSSIHSPNTAHVDFAEQPNVLHASTLPSVPSNHDDLDEDLIDYSDEEDVQDGPEVEPTGAAELAGDAFATRSPHEVTNAADTAVESNVADEQPPELPEHELGSDHENEQTLEPAWDHDDHQDAAWEQPSTSQYEEHGAEYPEEALVHDDQQAEQQTERPVEASAVKPSQLDASSHDDANASTEDRASQHEDHPAAANEKTLQAKSDGSSLLPVTVKYGASELWLIKTADSGDDDWLLEDESVVSQPLFNLFAACRTQLGEDLNQDTELGLHFDNFYGLEVFEESTACAYSTLKEYMDIYASLHTQDGLTEPQPMYVTLKFRPRVSALLAELKEAVEAGIGFRGLQEAVESGHSNFSEMVKEEEGFEEYWEEDELEYDDDQRHDAKEDSGGQHDDGSDVVVNGEPGGNNQEADASSGSQYRENADNEANARGGTESDAVPGSTGADQGHLTERDGEASEVVPAVDAGTETQATTAAPDSSTEESGNEGLFEVGFGDGEEEGEHRSSHHSHSTGVVQGDADAGLDDAENALGNGDHEDNDASHQESYTGDHETFDQEEAHEDHASQYNYEEDVAADDAEYAQDFETNEDDGEYADLGYGDADEEYHEEHEDFTGEPEEHDINTTTGQDGDHDANIEDQSGDVQYEAFNEVEEYAEFADEAEEFAKGEAPAYPDDAGEFFFDEEEAEAAAAAVRSPAAPPDVAPSASVDDAAPSPQGQKRPLDEVDVGSDGAGDESDAKKPKL